VRSQGCERGGSTVWKSKTESSLRGLPCNCSIGHESRHRELRTPAAMLLLSYKTYIYTNPSPPLSPVHLPPMLSPPQLDPPTFLLFPSAHLVAPEARWGPEAQQRNGHAQIWNESRVCAARRPHLPRPGVHGPGRPVVAPEGGDASTPCSARTPPSDRDFPPSRRTFKSAKTKAERWPPCPPFCAMA
jgi:hypothetical protein